MELRNNHQFDPFSDTALDGVGGLDGLDGIDFNNFDFNDPSSFIHKLVPVPPKIAKPDEVRREARERSRNVFDSFHKLQRILERHEATIQRRWLKKTQKQRLQILLQAWPKMAATHRPDFEAFRAQSKRGGPAATSTTKEEREKFVWPFINQEDLAKPRTLLLLLNSRGRYLPCEFAAADGESMHLGHVTSAVVPIFLNEYVMVLNGAKTEEEYGKLLAWEDHPDAFDWMHSRAQFLPGEGLLNLEAQERLLGFLVDCCYQILHEISPSAMIGDAYPVQPEPQLKAEAATGAAVFDSLAVMAAEAPYRVPGKLDFNRIISLLAARSSAAEDHLWTLREDPGYFSERLLDEREHRLEVLKDTEGKDHPVMSPLRQHVLWARVIGSVVVTAYMHNEVFAELLTQARHVQVLQAKYAAELDPTKQLPDEYMKAILRLRHYLDQAAKGPMTMLKTSVISSPPLRKYYVREVPPNPTTSMIQARSKPHMKRDSTLDELMWLLQTLWEDGKNLFFAKLPNVVDELERLVESKPLAKDYISPYVAAVIGDLSIISQCLLQLNLYQPWANSYDHHMAQCDDEIKAEFGRTTAPWGKFLSAAAESNLTTAVKLGTPTGGRFAYPFEKRRTRENVQALQQAEQNLDAFWASIDRVMYTKAGNLEGTATRRLLTQPKILHRTPDFVEKPTPKADDKKANKASNVGSVDSLVQPLSAFYFDLSSDKPTPGRGIAPAPSKAKTKTRGKAQQASESATETQQPEQDNEPDDVQPTFPVDARALKVFRAIFFNPNVNSTPGEIPWNDFLHAMASTGFQAEKLYGSVWQFRPTKLDVERSIQFHEPHPRGKIPYEVARRIGRRLNRAYGWIGGMFVIREK